MLKAPRKALVTSTSSSCIHGFDAGQCAACRTCPHGLTASRCGRCAAATASAARRAPSSQSLPQPADEERAGWQIFYVPELSGWQIRQPDAAPAPDSYRSLFLARKAVDQMGANASPERPTKRRK